MESDLSLSQKELLIRIDERQQSMERRLLSMESKLISTSEHVYLMSTTKEHATRLDAIEKWQAKIVAYGAVAGAVAGLVLAIVKDIITNQFKL